MSGEYWVELENNHHYIIVDSINDRTYYCPAKDVANTLTHKMNNYVKIIGRLRAENRRLKEAKKVPVFEITRKLDETEEHVAFVEDETLAQIFCDNHKDCSYGQIPMTKYPLHLEAARSNVPCCETCLHCENDSDNKTEGFCRVYEDTVSLTGYCDDWMDRDLE